MDPMGVFRKLDKLYKSHFDPVEDYIEHKASFLSISLGIPKEKAREFVKEKIVNGQTKNPKVLHTERGLNGDLKKMTSTLLGYVNYIKNNKFIMAPSFTLYFNPKDKKSMHSEFITVNVTNRNNHKILAAKFRIAKNKLKQVYHTIIQKVLKVYNNVLSGSYASQGTILYNKSAHYTLTSITRCVSGVGNILSESMISGNYHYRSVSVTINHLTTMVVEIDTSETEKVMKNYNLYVPTTDEIFKHLIKPNTEKYWRDKKGEDMIIDFIDKLSPVDKCKVVYTNNLFLLRVFNDKLVRGFISNALNDDKVVIPKDHKKYLKSLPFWIINLLAHTESYNLVGKKIDVDNMDDSILLPMTKRAVSFLGSMETHYDLIQLFFVTNVFPPTMGYIKEMIRKAIVLSNTDSTCATYQDWVKWFTGSYNITHEGTAVSAIVMTIVTQCMDHYIKTFGVNMNITPDKAAILKMKNEFFWSVFVNTDVGNHYYALVKIEEALVLDNSEEPELEIKGVHLIASTTFESIRVVSKDMIKDILLTVDSNGKLDMDKYLNLVLEVERDIKRKVLSGNLDMFKLASVKEEGSYKQTALKSPYFNYLFWNEVFGDKYGKAPEPSYKTVKIPLRINTNKEMAEFIESIEDIKVKESMKEMLVKAGKGNMKTFYPPIVNVATNGIPTEIKQIVDVDKIILDNCNLLYIILSTLGYYLKPGQKLIDIYGDED